MTGAIAGAITSQSMRGLKVLLATPALYSLFELANPEEGGLWWVAVPPPFLIRFVPSYLLALGGFRLVGRLLPRQPLVGYCNECGYNLTGNVSGRCPECGTPIPGEMGSSAPRE